ncbi:MAG: O-antigen ligase family protein [Acholeplasmatales bacterium]|nr:O-antigen ligase family protein [Acholeplasmatales bacterium]
MELTVERNFKKVNTRIRIKSIDRVIFFFMFLSTLFIGADVIGINIGVNFRLDQIFLVITALLMTLRNNFKIRDNKWIAFFLIFTLLSTILAINIQRAALFYFSIVYNVIFLFYLYSNFVSYYGPKLFIKLFRNTMYIQFLLMCAQFALKVFFNYEIPFMPSYGSYMGIERFSLWFYEPSYLSTFIAIWLVSSLYFMIICNSKGYIKDVIMALLMILMSTSTSGFILIALSIAVIYLMWIANNITVKKLLALVGVIILGLVLMLIFSDIFDVFIKRLFVNSLDESSGGRVTQWAETFEVFKDNSLFGIGGGNYGAYLGFDNSYVPSNVTLELMAVHGIFSAIAFYGLTISLIVRAIKLCKKSNGRCKTVVAYTVALVIFTIILQFNQGYLRLYHWMLFGILDGMIIYYNRKLKYTNKMKGICY